MTRPTRLAALVAALLVVLLGAVSGAAADSSQFTGFTVTPSTLQAGAHPDLSIDTAFATTTATNFAGTTSTIPQELVSQVSVALPPGILGNPTSFPTCEDATVFTHASQCPVASQVGTMTLQDTYPETDSNGNLLPFGTNTLPIINLPPAPDEVARLAVPFVNGGVVVHIDIRVNDATDFGLQATISNIPSTLAFFNADVELWGVPGASIHDAQRLPCFDINAENFDIPGCSVSIPRSQTFIVNPTSCAAGGPATATANFYGDPTTYTETTPVGPFTGCGSLPFDPSLSFTAASGQVGEPDGFGVDLQVPQAANTDTTGDTTSALSGVTVTLPSGVALSPGVADGLTACSDAQFGLGSHADQTCPGSSQVGTVTVDTPLISVPLAGALYVGQPESANPASGQMYRLFLAADGQGVHLKLVGSVSADPATGQLTASFPDDPQVPFDDLQLSLSGGPRAVLANPPTCGTATSAWSITPYAEPGTPATGTSGYPVTGDCALATEFTPTLSAGLANPQAGASSPFSFTLTRPDGQADLSQINTVALPLGLNASLADVPTCPDASASAGTCSATSQVGDATVTAGPGSDPLVLSGQPVYLTGPYEGAPYGLAVVVHAVAGPYDLGTVVVRQALHIDPRTAQITLTSDPLPVILGGVPLALRSIAVDIDRPGFIRSPTSCAPESVTATVSGSTPGAPAAVTPGTSTGYASATAATTQLSTPFQMTGCAGLPFSPRLAMTLSGHGRTRTGAHPLLVARLTQPAGQANLRSAAVTLPLALALDPDNSQHVCPVKAAARIACPKRTIVGRASAITRILPHPLAGPVYLVQGIRHGAHGQTIRTLPSLLVPLTGPDGVSIDLTGRTTVDPTEHLVAHFASIPDAGIRSFDIRITGGRRGLLVVTGGHDLCRGGQFGAVTEVGQNGARHDAGLRVATPACEHPAHGTPPRHRR